MLIPRFSLRWVLAAVGICGVAFLFLSLAVAGSEWAVMITAVLLSLLAAAFCHAVLFAVVWLLSLLVGGLSPPAAEHTPFRSETPVGPLPGAPPGDSSAAGAASLVQRGAADDAPAADAPEGTSGGASPSQPAG